MTDRLTGEDLITKVHELGDLSDVEKAVICGYVVYENNGNKFADRPQFYGALLEARGIDLSGISDGYFKILIQEIETRQTSHLNEVWEESFAAVIEYLAEKHGHPWLKLYPPANQLPGSKFKTITDAQLLCKWEWDNEHCFNIQIDKKNFIKWFDNIPCDEDAPIIEFEKYDKDMMLIKVFMPEWGFEVDREELEQAVLDQVFLREEWIDQIGL